MTQIPLFDRLMAWIAPKTPPADAPTAPTSPVLAPQAPQVAREAVGDADVARAKAQMRIQRVANDVVVASNNAYVYQDYGHGPALVDEVEVPSDLASYAYALAMDGEPIPHGYSGWNPHLFYSPRDNKVFAVRRNKTLDAKLEAMTPSEGPAPEVIRDRFA